MREVLYLPWGKKKSNQRKIEIKFNNLFGKKKKQKSFSSKANKTLMDEDWYFNWPKTNSSQKCRIVQKTKKEVEKKNPMLRYYGWLQLSSITGEFFY